MMVEQASRLLTFGGIGLPGRWYRLPAALHKKFGTSASPLPRSG
jgi:hypothetical protein